MLTPGPPVMTRTFDRSASRTASRWLSARVTPALLSTHGMAFVGIDRWPRQRTGRERSHATGDDTLGPMQPG